MSVFLAADASTATWQYTNANATSTKTTYPFIGVACIQSKVICVRLISDRWLVVSVVSGVAIPDSSISIARNESK